MANLWFRLYSEFASDPKIQSMGEVLQRRLIILFCLRCGNVLETLQENEIAFALGITEEEWQETKQIFVSKCFIRFISGKCNINNWNKRQFISDSSTIRVRKYRAKKETLQKRSKTVTVTAPDSYSEQIQKDKSPKSKVAIPEEAKSAASLLFTLHRDQIDKDYHIADSQLSTWSKDIEKINRIDGRSWQDIESVIRWIKTPGQFWAPNIMSGSKLREKFATVFAKMQQNGKVVAFTPKQEEKSELDFPWADKNPTPPDIKAAVDAHYRELEERERARV